ncbi:MAG: ATP:cob(I)alamin adenosyltransferase [Flavobacteriales bacterium CG_4_10_14_0_2_um_filter_32_8]|nr:MAG: ATP:cob(I)alamin adenosyltransferase [Flavobacteriales bacterium CG_4_10_14_0_2_um_filter_32_8]PJB16543.1 MAG: ATP:cob(I)alamin adenosyltransferase [Flavobacteriales bacterium CG_4_9_14_3_um_filter_32_8]
MKIYTKTGDKGQTSLFGGKRVAKHHIRIDAYGTVDELNSYIGLIRDQEIAQESIKTLLEIQDRLFTMGSLLATESGNNKVKIPLLINSDVTFLENEIDKMNEQLPEMKSFILPGGNITVSFCHIARCVCRRAERIVSQLSELEIVDEMIIIYLNRLSDYLFVLARKIAKDKGINETPWKARM